MPSRLLPSHSPVCLKSQFLCSSGRFLGPVPGWVATLSQPAQHTPTPKTERKSTRAGARGRGLGPCVVSTVRTGYKLVQSRRHTLQSAAVVTCVRHSKLTELRSPRRGPAAHTRQILDPKDHLHDRWGGPLARQSMLGPAQRARRRRHATPLPPLWSEQPGSLHPTQECHNTGYEQTYN